MRRSRDLPIVWHQTLSRRSPTYHVQALDWNKAVIIPQDQCPSQALSQQNHCWRSQKTILCTVEILCKKWSGDACLGKLSFRKFLVCEFMCLQNFHGFHYGLILLSRQTKRDQCELLACSSVIGILLDLYARCWLWCHWCWCKILNYLIQTMATHIFCVILVKFLTLYVN